MSDIIDDLLNLHGPGRTNYTCLKAADEIKQLRESERSAWNAAVDREADIDALKADLAAVRADQNIACTALCPHGLDIAAQHENAKRKLSEARSCLMELRMRFHAMGRRPEECYEMSIIDAALSEGSKT